MLSPVAQAETRPLAPNNSLPAGTVTVQRNYQNTSRFLVSSYSIVLRGSPAQVARLSGWLDQIMLVPIGRETLDAVFASNNELTIVHSHWALQASGRTRAPVTRNLTNGVGADVEILFDARIPESGSHYVFGTNRQPIEFTALQNLFHELAHARYMAEGAWRYFDSEAQAIEDENIFRRQLAIARGEDSVPVRAYVEGQQIWWPEADLLSLERRDKL